MAKYLMVDFVDYWQKEIPVHRVVAVPLTEEQEKMLGPRRVGSDGLRERYEEMHLLCVQEDPRAGRYGTTGGTP